MGILDRKKGGPLGQQWPTDEEVAAAMEKDRHLYPPFDPLPPHEDNPHCPKCGNLAVTIKYHQKSGHAGCVDRRFEDRLWVLGGPTVRIPTAEDLARDRLAWERQVEHMDRKCQNCGYGWVTDVDNRPRGFDIDEIWAANWKRQVAAATLIVVDGKVVKSNDYRFSVKDEVVVTPKGDVPVIHEGERGWAAAPRWANFGDDELLQGWRIGDLRQYQQMCRESESQGWDWPVPPIPAPVALAEGLSRVVMDIPSDTLEMLRIRNDSGWLGFVTLSRRIEIDGRVLKHE